NWTLFFEAVLGLSTRYTFDGNGRPQCSGTIGSQSSSSHGPLSIAAVSLVVELVVVAPISNGSGGAHPASASAARLKKKELSSTERRWPRGRMPRVSHEHA